MSRFVSYAQNCEDVMLWRALRDVVHGTYIDVGAHDPVEDSVTKAFYEHGWRGINIEPVPFWHSKLVTDRPEDVNLNVAVSSAPGEVVLHEVEGTGLSTMNQNIASRHSAAGWPVRAIRVKARTLDDVVAQYHPEVIHFLKIDVEGWELEVIRSIDLKRSRPWIILVEATNPGTIDTTFGAWEQLLIDRGYTFVYADGLNRFYVAAEKEELRKKFSAPPNVFDHFVRRREEWLEQHAQRLELDADSAANRIAAKDVELEQLKRRFEELAHRTALAESRAERFYRRVVALRLTGGRLHAQSKEQAAELARCTVALGDLRSELETRSRRLAISQDYAGALEDKVDEFSLAARGIHEERDRAAQAYRRLQEHYSLITGSRSWQITKPLRALGIFVRKLLGRKLPEAP